MAKKIRTFYKFLILLLVVNIFFFFGGGASMPVRQQPMIGDKLEYSVKNPNYTEIYGMRIEVTDVDITKQKTMSFFKTFVNGVYFNLTMLSHDGNETYKSFMNTTSGILYSWDTQEVINNTNYSSSYYPSYSYINKTGWFPFPYKVPVPSYLMIQPYLVVNEPLSTSSSLPVASVSPKIINNNLHTTISTQQPGQGYITYWYWDQGTGYLLKYEFLYLTAAYTIGNITYELVWSNIWPFSTFWFTAYYVSEFFMNKFVWIGLFCYLCGYAIFGIYDKRKRKVSVLGENAMWVIMFIVLAGALGFIVLLQYFIIPWLQG